MPDGVYISAGGDFKPLNNEIDQAIKKIQEFGNALDDAGKKAGGTSPGQGNGGGSKGLDQYRFSLDTLGESLLKSTGQFGMFMVALNSTFGVVGDIVDVVTSAISPILQFAEAIGGAVVDAVRSAAQELEGLTQQVFELNKSTEQNTGAWRFIYGGQQNAQDLMNWTSGFSMQVPYTRQDLMGAITALGRAGLNEDQVKQYMSVIADMGTLNPQRNLTGAAWSIQGAMHGYTRMLKYDYGISPDDLADFGLDPNNPEQTLLPALAAYLQARNITGSAKWAATNTFWGAESSFVDRLQNFGLQVGGTSLSGSITSGSMFDGLKKGLADMSAWWDDHQADITHIADILSNVLGGALQDVRGVIVGVADGIKESGFLDFMQFILTGLGQKLKSGDAWTSLVILGDALGKIAGGAATSLVMALVGFFDGLTGNTSSNDMILTLNGLTRWFNDPVVQANIQNIARGLGEFLGGAINFILSALGAVKQWLDSLPPGVLDAVKNGLIAIAIVLGGVFLLAITPIAGLFLAIVLAATLLVAALGWIKDRLSDLADWIRQHWPSISDTPPGNVQQPAPGGTGPTTYGPGGSYMASIAMASRGAAQTHYAAGGGALLQGSYNTSSTSNMYGGTANNSVVIHGAAETQIERIAQRVFAQQDAAQNVFSRRVGGYRPGLFGSIG